jgi:hypothetical protein
VGCGIFSPCILISIVILFLISRSLTLASVLWKGVKWCKGEAQCHCWSWDGWREGLNMMDCRVLLKLWQVWQHVHSGHKNNLRIKRSIGKVMNAILDILLLLLLRVDFGNKYWRFTGNNVHSSWVPKRSHVTWNSGYTCSYITFNFHGKILILFNLAGYHVPPPLGKYLCVTCWYSCTYSSRPIQTGLVLV